MSIVIPEHLLDSEEKANSMIAFANQHPSAADFERKLVTICIALRNTESKGVQFSNELYFDAIRVVLLKKGYTYNSICRAANFVSGNKKPANFYELSADAQDDFLNAEYNQAIALLQKTDAPNPMPAKIKVGDIATYTSLSSGRTDRGVIKNILLRKQASGKSGVDVTEIDSKDILLCIFDIGAHWAYGSYITSVEPQKPYIADVPAAKPAKTFLGSFVALAFAFSLSITACYIQPSGLSVRAYESKLNTAAVSTADAKCDKHQQHFELLQSRLKHGHSDALFFIKDYSKTAEQLGRAYDISPEIILAVGILESSSGTSNIAINSRNFHGIKAGDNWQGLTFTCANGKTWRAWNSSADGFDGFCQYICERMPHFIGKNITPAEFAAAYGSSDPKRYAEKLHLIIARYGLKTLFQYEQ